MGVVQARWICDLCDARGEWFTVDDNRATALVARRRRDEHENTRRHRKNAATPTVKPRGDA